MLRLFSLFPLLHLYVGLRLAPDLPPGAAEAAVLYLAASTIAIPLALLSRRMPQPRADRLAWPGFVMMGAFSSLFVLTVLRDIGLLLCMAATLFLPIDEPLQHMRAWSALAVPVLAGALSLAGFINARRRAAVRVVDVAVASLPLALQGFTIAQITDIHVGPTIKKRQVEAIVEAVNALRADMIAITGDLVDGSVERLSPHTEPLSRLSARHGVFFVTGNHEYYSGVHAWIEELRRLGLRVLVNAHVVLRHDGAALVVAGVTDYGAHHVEPAHRSDPAAALAGAPGDARLKLLLAHQPRSAIAAAQAGFHLQLSGHTHGGQFLPWNSLVRLQQPFTAGLHRLNDLRVYVSRSTGYWGPPKRIAAPSEITLLRLRTA